MSIKQLASTPCGRQVIDTNDLQALFNKLDQEGLAGEAEQELSTTAKAIDGAYEFYINALLSSPSTIGVNAVSNMVPVGTRIFETLAAAGSSKMRSKLWGEPKNRVTFVEAMAEAQGIGEGFKEAWEFLGLRFGKRGPKGATTESTLKAMNIPEELAAQSKIERKHRAIKGGNIENAVLAKGLDWLGNLISIPGGSLSRFDEVYKVINYRAEIAKRSMNATIAEMDASGKPWSKVEIQERYKAIKQESLDNQGSDIAQQGIADADRRTFTNKPGGGADTINSAMAQKGHKVPGLRWVVPFRRTMVNLISYGTGMTPAPLLNPKSQTWKALREGGGAADEALGRMAAGSVLISGLYYMLGDSLDGEAPANVQARDLWQKDGHAPDTLRMLGKNINLDNFGPVAMWLKIGARVQTAMSNIDEENDDDGESQIATLASEFLFHTADVMTDDHWVSSMGQLFTAVVSAQREGSFRPMEIYASKQASGFIPNFVKKHITRNIDPNIKDVTNSWDAFMSKVPWLSKNIANKISIWGEPIRYDHFLEPSYEEASTGQDPVSVEMRSIGLEFPERRRSVRVGDTTVRMTPEEFMQYQIWSGQGVDGATPLRDVVKARIGSKVYSRLSESGKADYLKDAMNNYAERAKQHLIYSKQFTFGQRVQEARTQNYHR